MTVSGRGTGWAGSSAMRTTAILTLALLLGACAVTPPAPRDPTVARCLAQFRQQDEVVAARGVSPSSPRRIDGFPYLRVDRFLASYRDESLSADRFDAWWWRLAWADRAARRIEQGGSPTGLDRCYRVLHAYDRNRPERRRLIRARARVPSDYVDAAKVFGLYPLTALPVGAGVGRYQAEVRARFDVPLPQLPVEGALRRYRPPSAPSPPDSKGVFSRDALGIPAPTPEQWAGLFARHAPIWEIDVAGDYDRPGRPIRRAGGVPGVDPSEPLVYRYASYTRWRGRALLQLNYQIWFDRRPLTGPFDILGGPLDGLIWRVTLDAGGQPLVYDTLHPCGCYHMLFPTPALTVREDALKLPEPPLVPQPAPPQPAPGERIVLRVASGTHYLERVYADVPSGEPYAWRDYRELYTTPVIGDGARSLFREDGIVAGSERAERYLLWPMGIEEPGAMRERGRHAIAFVGERHFDDPDLLKRFFRQH